MTWYCTKVAYFFCFEAFCNITLPMIDLTKIVFFKVGGT